MVSRKNQIQVVQSISLAISLQQSGRFAEAVETCRAILKIQPAEHAVLNVLGSSLLHLGEFAVAEHTLAAALRIDPNQLATLINYGIALQGLKRLHEASEFYERALALQPNQPAALNMLGLVLIEMLRFEEALERFDVAVTVAPRVAEIWCNRASALTQLHRLDEAIDSLDRAEALRPDYGEALSNRSIVLNLQRRNHEALIAARKALALLPDRSLIHRNIGDALAGLGRFDEALKHYSLAPAMEGAPAQTLSSRADVPTTRVEDSDTIFESDGKTRAQVGRSIAWTGTPPPVVYVIVPVYRDREATHVCVESVLRSTAKTGIRVILINDASPEVEVTEYLRRIRDRDARAELLENPANLGFVASVNRGMQHAERNDVVLLNSDTEVAGDWLDRLCRAAYSEPRVGTVTPFSNNATICSYPRIGAENTLPQGMTTANLDRLFAIENAGQTVEIPTAVGFCMYIRRDCLDTVGLFDVERFGRGYGEENDFCMRALKRGWKHLLALDTFVLHSGGASFGTEKASRVMAAQKTLQQLHPEYWPLVKQHLVADPASGARSAVDLARIRDSGLPSVLLVSHSSGGGTERHVGELASLLKSRANVFLLRPGVGGHVHLKWLREEEGLHLTFRLDEQDGKLVTTLKALGVVHVHFHHLLGHGSFVTDLPKALNVTHDFTVHDYYPVCPQISLTDHMGFYCGERGIEQCHACLKRTDASRGMSIEAWRTTYVPLLESARFVLAPSKDTAERIKQYCPTANVVFAPHFDIAGVPPVKAPSVVPVGRALRIVVLGRLSLIKGADVLESAAIHAARLRLPLEFHLLGDAYRRLTVWPRASLAVHGSYSHKDLPTLLDTLQPDVAWFPALWPETYSYTLSECLEARLPIIAPNLGAFPERLSGREWTWICPWDRSSSEWVESFCDIRRLHFATGIAPAPAPSAGPERLTSFDYRRDYLHGIEVSIERRRW